ncbi:NADPH-dependent ferric siderophore reductase [Cellulosimicrobium cellulans]|uniref:siderophore-interacting protein n=1 Tax=Cellulosimicrobium cellulans TaxID=1710 RepID=UPI001959DAE8|nr:siderophore-interacting protein [Cellulosimicrobium cellulans]MBM7819970.1 NADPH-dependent ferric siderophore reductase [Cellulosimicrobium cellulans]
MAQHRLRTHPLVLRRVEVARVVDVTPRMRRVTLVGPELGAFERDGLPMPAFDAPWFDDHVKIVLASDGDVASALPVQRAHGIDWPPAPNRQGRDYTPRRWDAAAGELDLDLVLHGDGPAAAWARSARPGSELWFVGPKASTVWPDDVGWALLAGDETALPAIGRFLDERPVDVPVQVVVTIGAEEARQDLALRHGDTVRWVVAPEGDRAALDEAVRALEWWPGQVYAWAASESRALLPVRRYLTRERAVPRTHVDVTGYWHAEPAAAPAPGPAAEAQPQPTGVPSPVPWFATRAALQLGLLDELGAGPRDAATLAEVARTAPGALRALVGVLAASGVVTLDGDTVALGDAGEDLLDDEHEREEYEGLEADALLALAALAPALRDGGPAWSRARGRSLRAEVETDADRAAEVVEGADVLPYVLTGLGTWPVWADARSVALGGPGALVVADLLTEVPGDRATTLVEETVPLGVLRERAGASTTHATAETWPATDVAVSALGTGHRTDDEVVDLLVAMRAAASRAVLVEDFTPDGLSPHAHERALLSLATTGSAPRTPDDVARLAERAGWRVERHEALGWGVEQVQLAARDA